MKAALQMNTRDNVATLISDVNAGEEVEIKGTDGAKIAVICAKQDIPFGNKIALVPIRDGDDVYKYETVIASCYRDIEQGEMVHIHNIQSNRIHIPQERIESMMEYLKINPK